MEQRNETNVVWLPQEPGELTVEQAQQLFATCTQAAAFSSQDQQANLRTIAWEAAREGVWSAFVEHYPGDAGLLIGEDDEARLQFIQRLNEVNDHDSASTVAFTVTDDEKMRTAFEAIAIAAANVGNGVQTRAYLELTNDQKLREVVMDNLCVSLARTGKWAAVEHALKGRVPEPRTCYLIAQEAARAGDFVSFMQYVERGVKLRKNWPNSQPDEAEAGLLGRTVKVAAQSAYEKGNLAFIAQLSLQGTPLGQALAPHTGRISEGVIEALQTEGAAEAAVALTAMGGYLTKGYREYFSKILGSEGNREWQLLEGTIGWVGTPVVSALQKLAYQEHRVHSANYLNATLAQRKAPTGKSLSDSDALITSMVASAEVGDWQEVMFCRLTIDAASRSGADESLVAVAASQPTYNSLKALLALTTADPDRIVDAVATIDESHNYEFADELMRQWQEESTEDVHASDRYHVQRNHLEWRASFAASAGHWDVAQQAVASLNQLVPVARPPEVPHHGYEYAALAALRVLASKESADLAK